MVRRLPRNPKVSHRARSMAENFCSLLTVAVRGFLHHVEARGLRLEASTKPVLSSTVRYRARKVTLANCRRVALSPAGRTRKREHPATARRSAGTEDTGGG